MLFTESVVNDQQQQRGTTETESPAYPQQRPAQQDAPSEKQWNYSGLDLINSGAAFWQNYSGMYADKNYNYFYVYLQRKVF